MAKELVVDVLVAGTGAAGLTAAVTARRAGLDVLVVEKDTKFGGTTAASGGVLWAPGNRHSADIQRETGMTDDRDNARAYILGEAGNYAEPDRIEAFLDAAPRMVDFLEEHSQVRFYGMNYPDYHSESPHSSAVRSLGTVDYDANAMGPHIKQLKNQLPQTLFFGFAIGSRVEMIRFMNAGRSIKALAYVARKLGRHFWDMLRHGEAQNLVHGRALIARLARSLFDMETQIWVSSPITRLIVEDGAVRGAAVQTPHGPVTVRVRRGVVLACGGFANDPERRAATFPAAAARLEHRNPAAPGNTGDGIRLAESTGGQFTTAVAQPAAWMPVSVVPGVSSDAGVWPHLIDRQKPGFIAVRSDGRRFGNESSAYHHFIPQLIRAAGEDGLAEAWLVADRTAMRKWGIGRVRPAPVPHRSYLRSGYLLRAGTLRELAERCGIDPRSFERTVAQFNADAGTGRDSEFGRGGRAFDIYQGDPYNEPNPCLAPLVTPPFYAVKIQAGLIGTFAGLRTDVSARVLDDQGRPVIGLYAVGNDQASVFGGAYPGAGSTIGPGMTFGYIAGRHLAGLPV